MDIALRPRTPHLRPSLPLRILPGKEAHDIAQGHRLALSRNQLPDVSRPTSRPPEAGGVAENPAAERMNEDER